MLEPTRHDRCGKASKTIALTNRSVDRSTLPTTSPSRV